MLGKVSLMEYANNLAQEETYKHLRGKRKPKAITSFEK